MFSADIQTVQAFGSYALAVAGLFATIITILFVHTKQIRLSRSQQQADWEDRFLANYVEFWKGQDLADVRYWITNDQGYGEIQGLLARRCAKEKDISVDEAAILEKIDKFCARLAVYDAVGRAYRHDETRIPWVEKHRVYWSGRIIARTELECYMELCWPTLLGSWVKREAGSGNFGLPPASPARGRLLFFRRKRRVADDMPSSAAETNLRDS